MKRILVTACAGLVALQTAFAGVVTAQSEVACPVTSPATARPVLRALGSDRSEAFRRERGLPKLKGRGQVRPLTDVGAADVCRRLNAYYRTSMYGRAPWRRTYFEAGGFYFASFVDTSASVTRRPRVGHFAIFNASLHLLGTASHR